MKHYYYLHVNGELISKPAIVVDMDPDYFDSDMVKRVWCIDTEKREDAWTLLVEALAEGASVERVAILADHWGCNEEDLPNYLLANMKPTEEQRKGMEIFITDIFEADVDDFWEDFLDKHAYNLEEE